MAAARTAIKEILSVPEVVALTRRSDAAAWWAIGSTWAIIGATFAALARWPHPVTFVLAVVVLGGRQLAFGVLMHEAAHRTLFRTRVLNDVVGDWLCGRPTWNDIYRYRKHHLRHHSLTGTDQDPDRSLSDPFPVTQRALLRKLARDVFGVSGVKRVVGLVLMDFEVLDYTVAAVAARRPRAGRTLLDYARAGFLNLWKVVVTNVVLAGVLAAFGHLWVYSAWVVAFMTTLGLFVRIRSIAEHACMARSLDPFANTRTVRAGVLARLTVAPFHVNYHMEHHLLVAVPFFRLPRMHRLLRERGVIPGSAPGYAELFAAVTRGGVSA